MEDKFGKLGITFDDVLLVPAKSDVVPSKVEVTSRLTNNISLNIPICSAPMDTVTNAELAIALAREGGIGIIHRNCSIEEQVREVDRVKRSESGMIKNPVTLTSDKKVKDALDIAAQYHIGGIPITREDGYLVGLITNRDMKYEENLDLPVTELMTPREELIVASEEVNLEEAKKILHSSRKEKLPIVDEDNILRGLITIKDIDKIEQFPNACKDESGRLRIGAAVGVNPDMEEVSFLVDADVDLIVIDSAHGHSLNVINTVKMIKAEFPDVELVAGNVATQKGTRNLIEAGADAVKVGIGPSSICTTRVIAGIGVPQMTAIVECASEAKKHDIPIIADGGIRYSGDITKAIAGGASSVMIGSLFAGTEESPGEIVIYQGRAFKEYRGMGSLAAMRERGGRERYLQEDRSAEKLVPEGIEGRVPYKGELSNFVYQLVGGLRAGMGYCGVRNISELQTKTEFIRITNQGLREGHPHDVTITEEAPNYSVTMSLRD